jgi:hypothetical protein
MTRSGPRKAILVAMIVLTASVLGAPVADANTAYNSSSGSNISQTFRLYYNTTTSYCRMAAQANPSYGIQFYKWDARWTRPSGATSGIYSASALVGEAGYDCDNVGIHATTGQVTFYPTFTSSTSTPWWYQQFGGWPFIVHTGWPSNATGWLSAKYYPSRQSTQTLSLCTTVVMFGSTYC